MMNFNIVIQAAEIRRYAIQDPRMRELLHFPCVREGRHHNLLYYGERIKVGISEMLLVPSTFNLRCGFKRTPNSQLNYCEVKCVHPNHISRHGRITYPRANLAFDRDLELNVTLNCDTCRLRAEPLAQPPFEGRRSPAPPLVREA